MPFKASGKVSRRLDKIKFLSESIGILLPPLRFFTNNFFLFEQTELYVDIKNRRNMKTVAAYFFAPVPLSPFSRKQSKKIGETKGQS